MELEVSLRSLRAFVVVAEELHFGRAAERLHVTQPPLTRAIQALEVTFGTQLFDRSTRQVRLTPAGVALLGEARRLLSDAQSMQSRVREAAEGRARTIRLGVIESATLSRMPAALSEFGRLHQDLHLYIHDLHSLEQLQKIKDHEIDWGLVRGPVSEPGLESAVAYEDALVAAVPAAAFEGRTRISLRELETMPLILYDQSLGSGFMYAVVTASAQLGFAPRVTRYATSTAMLLSLVAEGFGVGIVSEGVALSRSDKVRFVAVDDPTPHSPVLLVWREGEFAPELESLLDILRTSTYRGLD